ncbi:MAG: tRNA (adenosine(37)-N6)-threonylcarbamoyltransferase complex dimerization subunit type 1 TsaB [Pseudomonadota bacterium]
MNPRADLSHVLAFDTATEFMSVVLATPQGQWVAEEAGGAQASARLIPVIKALMAQAHCGWAALDAVAFGRGPGAFTGLRTACSVAQGLAFGAGKPVLALDTLMAVAEDARVRLTSQSTSADDLWVAMDARMNEIYAARYQWRAGQWQVLTAPHLSTAEALNQRWRADPPVAVAGTALAAFGPQLQPGATARCDPGALPRAAALVPLARQAWARGDVLEALHALPSYVRDKVAQTTVERDAAKAVAAAHGRG